MDPIESIWALQTTVYPIHISSSCGTGLIVTHMLLVGFRAVEINLGPGTNQNNGPLILTFAWLKLAVLRKSAFLLKSSEKEFYPADLVKLIACS